MVPGWFQDHTPSQQSQPPQGNRKLLQGHTRLAGSAPPSRWVPQAPASLRLKLVPASIPPPRTSDWGTKSHVELELAASGPLGSAAQQGSPGGGQSSTSHTHPPEKALLPCSKRLCRLGVEGEFVFTPSRLFLDDPELKSDPSSKLAKPPQDQYAPKNKFRRR